MTSGTALRTFKFYRHADSFLGDGVETGVCQPTDWVLSPCFSEHRRSGWLIGHLTVRFRLDRLSLLRVSPEAIGFPDLIGFAHPYWINAGLFFRFIDVVCFPLGFAVQLTIYTNQDFEISYTVQGQIHRYATRMRSALIKPSASAKEYAKSTRDTAHHPKRKRWSDKGSSYRHPARTAKWRGDTAQKCTRTKKKHYTLTHWFCRSL